MFNFRSYVISYISQNTFHQPRENKPRVDCKLHRRIVGKHVNWLHYHSPYPKCTSLMKALYSGKLRLLSVLEIAVYHNAFFLVWFLNVKRVLTYVFPDGHMTIFAKTNNCYNCWIFLVVTSSASCWPHLDRYCRATAMSTCRWIHWRNIKRQNGPAGKYAI